MATTIQVRSVDERMARAAKERASATHRSLSTYIKDLISADLERASSAERQRVNEILAAVEAGSRPMPTLDELLAELPVLTWPNWPIRRQDQ